MENQNSSLLNTDNYNSSSLSELMSNVLTDGCELEITPRTADILLNDLQGLVTNQEEKLEQLESEEPSQGNIDPVIGKTHDNLDKNANSTALIAEDKEAKSTSDIESCDSDGSEYIPSDEDRDDESFSEHDEPNEICNEPGPAVNASCESAEYSLSASFNVPGNSACDEREQIAEKSRGPKGGQKKNFCIYCKTQQSKIARHLENKHSEEPAVQKFLSLPKKNSERNALIAEIRKKGNFIFNVNKEWNAGKLIPVRRPTKNEKRAGQNFVPCAKCRGFYAKNNIRHHYRSCMQSKGDTSRNVLMRARQTVGRIHPIASLVLRRDVVPVMRDDNITRIIKYDELIVLYGNKQCKNLRLAHQHDEIRAHLRRLGRFLDVIRGIDDSITDMASVFDPKYYNAAVEAVNVLAGLDPKTQLYKTPSNASAIGTALKKLGLILEAECIKKHDVVKKKHTKDFLKLLAEDYGCSVNKGVTETLTHVKRTKKVNLPKTDDIRLLDAHLDTIIATHSERLAEAFDLSTWKNLAGAILIKLQVFNRRRAGELERLSVEEFENRQSIDENDELYKSLTNRDKVSAKKYVRIAIRGKLNRTVPVLMSTAILEKVQLLLKHRKSAKVPSRNPYIFGIASFDPKRFKHLRACTLMRQFASECGAQDESALRGTNLRKHIATRCVTLDLSEKQITRVANFMGHHENIHREIYRQPVAAVDILDMSKVLEKAQGLNETDGSESTRIATDQDTTGGKDTPGERTLESTLGTTDDGSFQESPRSHPQPNIKTPSRKRPHSSSGESSESASASPSSPDTTPLSQRMASRTTKRRVSFHLPTSSAKTSKPVKVPSNHCAKKCNKSASCESPPITSPESSPQAKSTKKTHATKTVERPSLSLPGKTLRRRWTDEEKKQVYECFKSYIDDDTLPSLQQIAKVQNDRNYLRDRAPEVVKTWIHNQLRNKKNGRPVDVPKTIEKAIARHVAVIFEENIANGKPPTLKECETTRKKNKKLQSLSAKEIREIIKSKIKT